MSFTRPEGVAIVSKATEPTTRMLMNLRKTVGGRWSLVVGVLLQIFSQYQLQLLFGRGRNFGGISQNGVRQRRPALARARRRHCRHSGLHDFRGVLGVF